MAIEPESKDVTIDSNGNWCPACGMQHVASNVVDVAFSIHYVDDVEVLTCHACGHTTRKQYGYKGVA